MKKILLFLFFSGFVASRNVFPVDAHQTAINHLQCDTVISTSDMVQTEISFHRATGVGSSFCTNWDDDYEFNGPPPTPLPGCFPGGDHVVPPEEPYPVAYKVIAEPTSTVYTATQNTTGTPFTCDYILSCTESCAPPVESGLCDANCDIDLNVSASCPRYGESYDYIVTSNAAESVVFWDDTTITETSNANAPTPGNTTVSKTIDNPGRYDVMVKCGTQTCHKRYQTVCQTAGAGTPTPSPFSTITPTPTGAAAACSGSLVCSHPCSCDQSSLSYINAGCGNGLVEDADYGSGYGSVVGTNSGNACGPGLVCCTAPANPVNAWTKVKGASYHDNGSLINNIPANATTFNGDDTGDCNQSDPDSEACFDVGQSGIVTAEGTIDFGTGSAANYRLWSYGNPSYNISREFTPDIFIQYALSRRETVNISDPEDVEKDKVNYISGDEQVFEIDNNGMQGKAPFILLIDNGDLRFELSNKFNSSNKSMVIVVDGTVEIKSSMDELNGIFIANDFDFAYDISEGSTTSNPLLLNGGIISMNDVNCAEKRQRSDTTKPSCFFTFDFVEQYLPVMDLFSTRTFTRTSN